MCRRDLQIRFITFLSSLSKEAEKYYLKSKAFFQQTIVFFGAFLLIFMPLASYGNPLQPQVAAGTVSIQQSTNTTIINQSSQKAIINWRSFNIKKHESTHFQQPQNGIALNRIDPTQGASQIYGRLSSTGKIILVNQAGIYFGPGSFVNVGGIIASTSDISNKNFLAGKYSFDQPSQYQGSIVNEGTIRAANNGLIALVGNAVSNEGTIEANLGSVVLASGNKFTVSLSNDQLINFTIDEESKSPGIDPRTQKKMPYGVNNSGAVYANGGKIIMSSHAAKGVLDHVINMSGVAVAKSVSKRNGQIILGGGTGSVSVSGKMDVSNSSRGKGGKIKVLAEKINIDKGATLDASGELGGGEILIGGNAYGAGSEPHALHTYVAPDVLLQANATDQGDGGKIVVWSDNLTQFYGTISATGGIHGGNGGWVETSGKKILDLGNAKVQLTAPNGQTGTWLLDPENIVISTGSTSNGSFDGSNPNTFTPTGDNSVVNNTTIMNNLATANVIITTGTTGSQLGDITVSAPISWSSANSLTLQAAHDIAINSQITTGASGSSLVLDADGNMTQSAIIAGSGNLVLSGFGSAVLSQANTYSGSTTINLEGGNLTFSGSGSAVNSSSFTVNQGSKLTLDNTSTNVTNRLGDAAPINLNGGQFIFKGSSTTNASESVGALNLSSGTFSQLVTNSGTGGSTILTFASMNHAAGSTLYVTGTNLGVTPGAGNTNIFFTDTSGLGLVGGTTQLTKPIVPFAAGSSAGNDGFLTYNLSPTSYTPDPTGLRVLNVAGEYSTTIANGVNLNVASSLSSNSSTPISINSLRLSGGSTFTIGTGGGGKTVTITSGAIASTSGSNILSGRSQDTLALGGTEGKLLLVGGNLTHNLTSLTAANLISVSGINGNTYIENRALTISGASPAVYINSTLQNSTSAVFRLGTATPWSTLSLLSIGAGGILDLNGFSPNFNTSGTSLALANGATQAATIQGSGTLTLGPSTTVNINGPGAVGSVISSNVALGANQLVTVNSGTASDDFTLSGIMSGSFNLTKAGAGALALTGTNTFTGTLALNAGILDILSDANLGTTTNPITFNGGTLLIANPITLNTNRGITLNSGGGTIQTDSGTVNYAGVMTGTGALTKTGTGTLNLSGLNNYTGGTFINAGTLTAGALNVLPSTSAITVASGATLSFNNAQSVGSIAGAGTISAGATLTTGNNNTSTVFSGALNGTGALTKVGSGTLTFSGVNGYSGVTLINGGTLSLSIANSINNSASITVASGATFDLNFNGTLGNTNTLTLNGAGVSSNGALTFSNGSGTTLSNAIALATSSTIGGSGSGTLNGIISGVGSALVKNGSGTLTLNNANTYSGSTTVSAGTLTLSHIGGLGSTSGTTINSSATLNLNFATPSTLSNSNTISMQSNANFIVNTSSTQINNPFALSPTSLFVLNADTSFFGAFSNLSALGGLSKSGSGTMILNAAGSYTGGTTITEGRAQAVLSNSFGTGQLLVQPASSKTATATLENLSSLANSSIGLDSSASSSTAQLQLAGSSLSNTIALAGTNNLFSSSAGTGTGTLSGIISGAGNIIKSSGFTLILSGNNTYTGGTTINGGILQLLHNNALGLPSASNYATIASGATLDIQSQSLTIGAGKILTINGTGVSGNGALISGSGTIAASGSGSINLATNSSIGSTGTFIISSPISGLGLTKVGSGILALNGTNTYTGGTTISAGTIRLGNSSGLGAPSGSNYTTIDSGAALNVLSSFVIGNGQTLTVNGTGVGGNGALITSSGTAMISGLGTGSINLATNSSLGGAGTLILSSPISGLGLTKVGNGTLTLNGTNTFTGGTTISAGTLQLGNSAALGSPTGSNYASITSGATLNTLASLVIGNGKTLTVNGTGVSGNGALIISSGTATISSTGTGSINLATNSSLGGAGSLTISSPISGLGLTKVGAGTLTLSGTNLYTGSTLISAGTLKLLNTNALGSSSDTTIANNAIFDLAFTDATLANTNTININGSGSGTGALLITGNHSPSFTLNNPLVLQSSSVVTDSGTGNLILAGTISGTNTNLTITANNGGVTLPDTTLNTTGNLTIVANGAINQTGILTIAGTSSFNAGSNLIDLSGNNVFTGGVTLNNSRNNNISVTNTIALNINSITMGSGLLTLDGVGVSQSGAIIQDINSSGTIINAHAGEINLTDDNNNFTGSIALNNTGNYDVSLKNASTLQMAASSIGSGALSLFSNGNITQTGAITQASGAGSVTFTLSSNLASTNIDLSTAANDFTGTVSFAGTLGNIQDLAFRNINSNASLPTNLSSLSNLRHLTLIFDNAGIDFPTLTLHNSGNLAVTANGAITQSGALTVPGTSSISAGANAITLTNSSNALTGAVTLSNSGNNNVSIRNNTALTIASASVGSGAFTLNGIGISQTGAITQEAGALSALINGNSGAIDLSHVNNSFTSKISLNNTDAYNVALVNNGALTLDTSSIGSGTFTLTSNGNITQTGIITQAASAGAMTIIANAISTNIDLSTFANTLSNIVTFGGTLTNIQDFAFRNTNSSAALPTNLASLTNLRHLTLTFNNAAIMFPALTLHNSGNLVVTANGAITQSGALTVPGTSSFSAGANAINLTNSSNALTGGVTLSNSGNNNVSLTNSIALNIASAIVGMGTLSLNGLGISQSGLISQSVGAGAVSLSGNAGPINLANPGNIFRGTITLSNTGNNAIDLVNTSAIVLGASTIGSGNLSLTSNGNISQAGAISQSAGVNTVRLTSNALSTIIDLSTFANNFSGTFTFDGTLTNILDFKLRNTNTGALLPTNLTSLPSLRNLTLNYGNAGIALPALTLNSGGSLAITSGNTTASAVSITQTGVLTVPGTSSFTAGAHPITLTENNNFTGTVALSNSGNNNISVRNSGVLNLGTSTVGTGTLTLTGTGVSQTLGTGTILQSAGAGAVTINAGAGPIALINLANSFTGTLILNNSGPYNVAVTTVSPLQLGTSSIGTGTFTINNSGAVTQVGAITQANGAGAVSITALGNSITLTQANYFTGRIALINSGANNVSLTNNTAIVFNTTSVGLGTFNIIAAGPITQLGTITQATNAGIASFNAGANAITLSQNNVFTGPVSLNNTGANDITLNNLSALILGSSSVGTGLLNITAGGALTQTGALEQALGAGAVTVNVGANAITMTQNNVFTGDVSLNNSGNNNVALVNDGLLTMGASTLGSGSLSLTGTGVRQSDAITQALSASNVTISAGAGIIDLDNTGNVFTGSIALSNSGANDVSLYNTTSVSLNTSSIGSGQFGLTANGSITQTGVLTQALGAGTITLAVEALNSDILLGSQANNLTGGITFGGTLSNIRDVSFRNINSSAALPTGLNTLSNLRNLTLRFDNAGMALSAINTSGSLTVTAGGNITQSGALTITGTPTFTLTSLANISLASNNNNFTITPVITSNSNVQNLSLRNINASAAVPTLPTGLNNFTLSYPNAAVILPALTLTGNLNITSGGSITQSGALNISNTSASTTLAAGASNNITLTNANNNFSILGVSSGNNVNVTTLGGLNLAASTISGNFTLNANGNIIQSGIQNIAGTTSITTGSNFNVTLSNASNVFSTFSIGNAKDVTINNSGNLSFGASTVTGNLTAIANGTITQSGMLSVANLASFNAGATNDITLAHVNNNFNNLSIVSGKDVTINDASAIQLATSTISGDFDLTTNGAVTQSGPLVVNGVGKSILIDAGSGNITLNNGNNDFTAFGITSGNVVLVQDLNDLILNATSSQSISTTVGGSLTTAGLIQTAGGDVNLAATGAGTITIGVDGIKTSLDQISAGGAINISAANTANLATTITINGLLSTEGGTGGILTLGGGTDLNVAPTVGAGDITLEGSSESEFFGNLNFTTATIINVSNADLIIDGPITSTGVGSNLTFISDFSNSGNGGIRIVSGGSIVSSGDLSLSGSNLYANPGVSIQLDAGTSIEAAGSISLLGNLGNSNILINGSIESTGLNQPITITPAGTGLIQLGANLTTNNGNIVLDSDASLVNNMTLKTAGGSITANAINTSIYTLLFDMGSANLSLTNSANNLKNVRIISGNNIQLVTANSLNLGSSTIDSNLTITAGGDIINTGDITVAGATNLSTSGSITLDSTNNDFNTFAVSTADSVLLNDINSIDLGPMNLTGDFTLTADGDITQSGGAITADAVSLSTNAANDITLNNINNVLSTLSISNGNNVSLNTDSPLHLNDITIAGNLSITTTGDITQNAPLVLNSNKTATFAVGSLNDLTLSDPNNEIANIIITNANNVTLSNSTAISFDTSAISGDLSINSDGAITQTGVLSVTGLSNFSANGAPITLSENNNFTGDVSFNNQGANNIYIVNSGLLTIGPTSSIIGSGTLTLVGAGIMQNGAIIQAANAGAVSLTAGSGAITLDHALNSFTGSIGLSNSGNNNITLVNAGPIVLDSSNVGSGTLTLTSAGSISQNGGLIQASNAGLITLASTASASNMILNSALNDLNGGITFGGTPANIQDVSLRNVYASASLPTNLASLTNLRSLTLYFNNTGIALPALTLHNSGNLSVTAGGAITQSGALVVPGTSSFDAGANPITLTQTNTFTGDVTLNNSGNYAVSITNSGLLSLGLSSIGSSTFTTNSVGLTQTGAITQAASAGTMTINAGAGIINLNIGSNIFTGPIVLNNSGSGSLALTNSLPITLGASSIGTGTFAITSGGTLSQTGPITQAPGGSQITVALTAPSSDIIMNQANSFTGTAALAGDLSNLRDANLRSLTTSFTSTFANIILATNLRNLTLVLDNSGINQANPIVLHNGGNLYLDTSGSLSGGTGGNIVQLAGSSLVVPGTTTIILGNHSLTANQTNLFTGAFTVSNSGNNNISIVNAGALVMGASTIGSGTLSLTGVSVSQTGAIRQAESAGNVTINGTINAIGLTNANNHFTGSVSLLNTGTSAVALVNDTALSMNTSSVGSGILSLTSAGDITQIGPIVQAANATGLSLRSNAASSNITLGSFANSFTGPVSFAGTVSNIQDVALRNTSSNAVLPVNLATLTNLRHLTLTYNNAGITFSSLSLKNGGNLSVTTGGAINQSGALTVPGTSSFNSGANAINLTNSSNAFTGAVTLTNLSNNNVSLTNNGALTIASASVGSGAFTLNGIGISQTGAITQAASASSASFNANAGVINLNHASNSFTSAVSLSNTGANNVTLVNNGALSLGTSTIGSGTFSLTSNGHMTQTGIISQAINAGTMTITANAASTNVDFSSFANNISGGVTFGETLANIQDFAFRNTNNSAALPTNLTSLTNLRNLTLTYNNTGISFPALTLHNSGNLVVTSGGAIIQSGALTVPGTSSFNSGANAITLTNSDNALTGGVTLSNTGNNAVSLTNNGALTIASASVGSGAFTLNAIGISQTGAITQAASASSASFNANAGVINLNNANNSFTSAVSLSNTGANNVTLVDNGALSLGASSIGSGTFSLTSNGDITQTGAIVQAASAGSMTLSSNAAATRIDLNSFGNDINGAITFGGTLANIQDFALRNINSSAALPTNLTSLTNLRNLTLTYNNTGISFPALTLRNGGSLVVTSGGAIIQSGALTVPGTSSFNSGANAITLANSNNALTGGITLSNTGNHAVSLTNNGALTIASASVGSGAFSLNGIGISQTGAITQAASASSASFNANAGVLNLNNASNSFTSAVSLSNTGANNVTIVNNRALILNTSSIGSGAFSVTSNGNISQIGAITQAANAGIIALSANGASTNIDLSTAANNLNGVFTFGGTLGNIQDFAFRNINSNASLPTNIGSLTQLRNASITFDNADITLPTLSLTNNLTLNANGIISQTGDLTAANVITSSVGGTVLTDENSIGTFQATNTGGGNIELNNLMALTINGISQSNGDTTITNQDNVIIAGEISGADHTYLTSLGSISETGSGFISSDSVTTESTGGLSLINDNLINNFTATNSSGDITINNSASTLTLLGLSNDGNITVTNEGDLINAELLEATNGDITLTTSAANSDITILGEVQTNTANHSIELSAANNTIYLANNITSLEGSVALNDSVVLANNVTIEANDVSFSDGISGAYDLTLSGNDSTNQFALNGTLSANNIFIQGAGSDNYLTIGTYAPQTWSITGTNTGTVDSSAISGNVVFNDVQNLIGGSQDNTYQFSNGARLSGVIDGGSLAYVNTLDYSLYHTPVTVSLSNSFYAGDVLNQSINITEFTNINYLIGEGISEIEMPSSLQVTLNFTSQDSGYIADPIYFDGFRVFGTANSHDPVVFDAPGVYNYATEILTINNVPVSLRGFNPQNFSGDITFINVPPTPGPSPTPTPTPTPTPVTTVNLVNVLESVWYMEQNPMPNPWMNSEEMLSFIANLDEILEQTEDDDIVHEEEIVIRLTTN